MWRITKDLLSEPGEQSRVGTSEEHSRISVMMAVAGMESEPLPEDLPLIPFRLKDDDGEIYYEGELHDDEECLNQEAALSYGMNDAGCTTIEVMRDGSWQIEIC